MANEQPLLSGSWISYVFIQGIDEILQPADEGVGLFRREQAKPQPG